MADIKKAPDAKPYGLGAPTRGSSGEYSLTAKWSIPSNATDSRNERRIEGFDVHWNINCYNIDSGKTKTLYYQRRSANTSLKEWKLWLNSFKCTDGKTYSRAEDFYPIKGYWCIRSVTVKVRCYNRKGEGAWVTATREFLKPRQPTIESVTQDAANGVVTVVVKHDKGQDYRENWSTCIQCRVWDSYQKKYLADSEKEVFLPNTETSKTIQIADIYARMLQSYDDHFRVDVTAWSRGLWGRSYGSKWADAVRSQLFVSWPTKPVIEKCDVSSPNDVTGKITFTIETGYHPYREKQSGVRNPNPSTGVKLERLVNVDYQTAQDIPGSENWDECGAVDNGVCTALSSTVAELQPEVGKVTWVRVKSWNQAEDIFFRYSEPRRMTELEREAPSAVGDSVVIADARSGDDGKSAVITLGWPTDDSTGTEVAWSESPNAWRSTDEPDTFRLTWDDGPATVGSTSYAHTAVLHISSLDEGVPVHIRARRYHVDADDVETFGDWYPSDSTVVVVPVSSPSSVVLSAPSFVKRGSAIPLSWTFDSEAEQTAWEVITGDVTAVVGTNRIAIDESAGDDETPASTVLILASGTDAMGSCTIGWDEHLAEIVGSDDALPLAVRVRTGGDPVTSDAAIVRVADPPTLSSVSASTVTEQPLELGVSGDSGTARLTIVVRSQGVSGGYANGDRTQSAGDAVWSTSVSPGWVAGNSGFSAAVVAPTGLDLVDGGMYTVSVVATDPVTGLSSEQATCEFAVAYDHAAPEPSVTSVIAFDTTDPESLMRTRGCTIELAEPQGYDDGDVYDLYRLTPDGPYLCASGIPLDTTITDPYAPFGAHADLAYRVCCRTADGCEEWADYSYTLPGSDLRVDFGNDYVELPYDIKVSDGYSKDFEARQHLDGSIDGYWNMAVSRTAGLSTDVIKLYDEPRVNAVRRLARHAGPCFVRTPDGNAYQANVNVGGISRESGSFAVAVTLDATEVGLTTDYMAPLPNPEPSGPDEEPVEEE